MLKVKPFQETLDADMCGPASLKIVLEYYGVDKSEDELAQLCKAKKGLGTDDRGIKAAAEKLGFKVKIKNNSSFKDIENWLKKGVPVIVDWFTRGRNDYPKSETADGHYSVVIGLDDESIYLQDPEIGKIRKIKRHDFMQVWFDFTGNYIKKEELIIRQIIAINGLKIKKG
jgi:predicted double-glycine peptidase